MSKKIKVLHFVEHVNQNDFVDSIIRNLNFDKFDVYLCITGEHKNFKLPDYTASPIRFINLELPGRKNYFKATWKVLRLLKKEKIDILHCHLYDFSILGAFIKLLSPGIKFIFTRHYSDDIFLTSKGLKLRRALLLEKFTNKVADAIVAPSNMISKLLKGNGAKARKIHRIDYAFDFSKLKYIPSMTPEKSISFKEKHKLPTNKFIIGNFARHYFLKNQENIITAIHTLTTENVPVHLVLAGEGPLSQAYREQVARLGLQDHITFTGWITPAKEFIEICDLIVHPTQGEAFPQIMVECMALQKTIAITRVSAASEHVQNGITGVFIEDTSVTAIIKCINEFMAKREQSKSIGRIARTYVLENLNLKKIIPAYDALYTKLKHPQQ